MGENYGKWMMASHPQRLLNLVLLLSLSHGIQFRSKVLEQRISLSGPTSGSHVFTLYANQQLGPALEAFCAQHRMSFASAQELVIPHLEYKLKAIKELSPVIHSGWPLFRLPVPVEAGRT